MRERAESGEYRGQVQEIVTGSYVTVPDHHALRLKRLSFLQLRRQRRLTDYGERIAAVHGRRGGWVVGRGVQPHLATSAVT
jgi:hypothetical protein